MVARQKRQWRFGFTLIEVLTAVVIIGILMSLTSFVYGSALARSRDQKRLSDLEIINNALEQYHLDNHSYPKVGENSNKILAAKFQLEKFNCTYNTPGKLFLAPSYIATIPEDPQYLLNLGGEGNNCSTDQFGQYLYVGLVDAAASDVQSFYLMARAERTTNMSTTAPTLADLKYYSRYFDDNNLRLCKQGEFTATCSHTYFRKSSRNR